MRRWNNGRSMSNRCKTILLAILLLGFPSAVHAAVVPLVLQEVDQPLIGVIFAEGSRFTIGERQIYQYQGDKPAVTVFKRDADQLINAAMVDLGGDGQSELVLTARRGTRIYSAILSRNAENKWQLIADQLPWSLRVGRPVYGANPVLMGQQVGERRVMRGFIHKLQWQAGKLTSVGVVQLPKRIGLYSFRFFAKDRLLAVEPDGRLRVWHQKKSGRWRAGRTWSSHWRAWRAVSIPGDRPLLGGNVAAENPLPLPPLILHNKLLLVSQVPAMRQTLGRLPLWQEWNVAIADLSRDNGSFSPQLLVRGEGAVTGMTYSPDGKGIILTVQYDRDDPLFRDPIKSRILRIDLGKTFHIEP